VYCNIRFNKKETKLFFDKYFKKIYILTTTKKLFPIGVFHRNFVFFIFDVFTTMLKDGMMIFVVENKQLLNC